MFLKFDWLIVMFFQNQQECKSSIMSARNSSFLIEYTPLRLTQQWSPPRLCVWPTSVLCMHLWLCYKTQVIEVCGWHNGHWPDHRWCGGCIKRESWNKDSASGQQPLSEQLWNYGDNQGLKDTSEMKHTPTNTCSVRASFFQRLKIATWY